MHEQYAAKMRFLCLRYVNDMDDVNDISQDAFVKVYVKINTFKDTGPFEAWMKKIFINTALKHLEKKSKREISRESPEDYSINKDENGRYIEDKIEVTNHNDHFSESELVKIADFTVDEILESAYALPDHFRVVFNLHTVDCLKHQEIAQMLKISENTSKTRLLRARKMLQKELVDKAKQKLKVF